MALSDVFSGSERWHVALCDNRFALQGMPAESVDAVVCDPPYELAFMGRRWDASGIAFDVAMWAEVLRVAKPGAHLLAFGGTRTWHRLVCAIEDAGWEIRDCLCWMYGSAMPKSLDVAKAIDKDAGYWRGRAGSVSSENAAMGGPNYTRTEKGGPITAAAAAAAGYGTNIKPAWEPICMARKPLDGTVAANFMKYGTGALNIDATRIPFASEEDQAAAAAAAAAQRSCLDQNAGRTSYGRFENGRDSLGPYLEKMGLGRWPANVILDQDAAEVLDASVGDRPGMSGGGVHRDDYAGGMFGAIDSPHLARNDSGGPSRFFYTAKAARSERDAGLEDFISKTAAEATNRKDSEATGTRNPRAGAGRSTRNGVKNTHPTVKPVDVMQWLVRLVCPPGGIVLDPFTGSGTTGQATMLEGEGRRFAGLEIDPLHVDFARARIVHVVGGAIEREVKSAVVPKRQPSLFDGIGAIR